MDQPPTAATVLAPEHAIVDELVAASPSWGTGVPAAWTGGAATPAEAVNPSSVTMAWRISAAIRVALPPQQLLSVTSR